MLGFFETERNCNILHLLYAHVFNIPVSSFVPADTSSSQSFSPDLTSDKDTVVKNRHEHTSEIPFKRSDVNIRNAIPPPNERDIVRKSIQGSTRVDSPLGSLRVNSTGLPLPPAAAGSLQRSKVR